MHDAATALSFAVLTAPKLYGLNVIGVTASALLFSSWTPPMSTCLAALAELPPVHALAERTLSLAVELEQVVDMIRSSTQAWTLPNVSNSFVND